MLLTILYQLLQPPLTLHLPPVHVTRTTECKGMYV